MRKSLLTLLLVLLAMINMAYAQEKVVTGTITQKSDGTTIPGATISLKGTRLGTTTNQYGKFSIRVSSSKSILVVSFVGMTKTEVEVGSQSVINVEMNPEITSLDEVIVVAYGTSTKKSFTGAAVSVDSKRLTLAPVTNITKALEGAAPGIQVTAGSGQPGSGPDIRIRGFGSVQYSGSPLIVVDNVPYNGTLANLNPDDIESVTILKDAASTALYGNQAANGVVVVTTKKGNKDRNQIQVKIAQGLSTRAVPEYDRVSRDQYYPLMWEAYKNSLISAASPVPSDVAAQIASGVYPLTGGAQVYNGKTYLNIKQNLGMNPYNVADNAIVGIDGKLNPAAKFLYPDDLDWEKAISRVGKRGDYGLSFSGGGPKSDYFVSMGYLNEKGFVIKSDYERITARININANPITWFKTGLNVSGTITNSLVANDATSTGYVNPFYVSRNMAPIYPIYMHNTTTGDFSWDSNGNPIYDIGATRPVFVGRHIIAETNYNDNLFKRNSWTGKTYGEISFTNDLKFTTNLSIELNNYDASTYENKLVGDGSPGGRASKTNTLTTTFNINQLLNYNKTLGKHTIEGLLGHENQSYLYNYGYGFATGQIADGNSELINFTTIASLNTYTDKYRKEGYFGRLNYNFDNKYYLSASIRRDGSSKFEQKVRWGNFWSVGGGIRLDQQPFMKSIKPVDALKLRASYGTVGSDNELDYYAYQALYALAFNNALEPGILQSSLGNMDIQWETNTNFDIGLDFGLFKRVTGTFEYYQRQSKNLLMQVNLPLSSGMQIQNRNVGTMANSGFEFSAKTQILKASEFKWNIDLNLSTVKNEFKKLPFTEQVNGTKKYMVGHSIYDYWLRESMGVDPADGSALYRATTLIASSSKIIGNDTVTTDPNNARYHFAGSAIPDLYGSVATNFSYKNFDLTFAFSFQIGGKIYDANYAVLMSSGSYGNAMSSDILNRWQKPGDITNIPRLDVGKASYFGATSDRFLTSGTYFNFKTINFGYNLPLNMVRKLQMQNVRVYLSGDNLWLKSSRTGLNPTQIFSGVTSNAYVPARIVTVGLNVTL